MARREVCPCALSLSNPDGRPGRPCRTLERARMVNTEESQMQRTRELVVAAGCSSRLVSPPRRPWLLVCPRVSFEPKGGEACVHPITSSLVTSIRDTRTYVLIRSARGPAYPLPIARPAPSPASGHGGVDTMELPCSSHPMRLRHRAIEPFGLL